MADMKQIANDLAEANRADVILINASMDRGTETKFIEKARSYAGATTRA